MVYKNIFSSDLHPVCIHLSFLITCAWFSITPILGTPTNHIDIRKWWQIFSDIIQW